MSKICNKCSKIFPSKIKINGKIKILSSRKYCLDCSPWGKHNTKQLESYNKSSKQCGFCKKLLSLNSFYSYKRSSDNKKMMQSYCKKCINRYSHIRQLKLKKKAIGYLGGECHICSYNKSIAALHFHHRDPTQKEFSLSWARSRALEL